MPIESNTGQEDQLAQSVTAVLMMVNVTTWVAYVDELPKVSAEGGTAHEAFRGLVSQLHRGNYAWLHPGPPTITRIKLVRPSTPL